MDTRPRVKLPNEWIKRCRIAGAQMMKDWENPQTKGDARSASLSSHGAERNQLLLARSKMAEVTFCIWGGLNPEIAIQWRHADDGLDMVWRNVRIDVKHSSHASPRYLIWPINKRKIFDSKKFDVMVLVSGTEPIFTLIGWITKELFSRHFRVSSGSDGLTQGTWFYPVDELWSMDWLESAEGYFKNRMTALG
jgi:hypothetical protein